MKKIIQASTLMMAFGLSIFLYTPDTYASHSEPCGVSEMTGGLYNMKNRWFGGCKTKCGSFCDTDREGEGLKITIRFL